MIRKGTSKKRKGEKVERDKKAHTRAMQLKEDRPKKVVKCVCGTRTKTRFEEHSACPICHQRRKKDA